MRLQARRGRFEPGILVAVLAFCGLAFAGDRQEGKTEFLAQYEKKVRRDIVYDYILKLPDGYEEKKDTQWPLGPLAGGESALLPV